MQLIALKLSGEATIEELTELEDYLIKDPEAGYSLEILKAIWNPATNLGEEPGIRELFEAHREKYATDFESPPHVFSQPGASTGRRRHKRAYVTGLSLVTVLLLAGGIYWFANNKKEGPRPEDRAEIIVKKGSRSRVLLPDSTEVWLNSGSRLTYDKEMNSRKERLVTLSGEGYFVVENKKEQPFIINTEKLRIRVLGTAFNVKAYTNDTTTETTLIRGKIEISMNNAPDKKLILHPNEKFSFTNSLPEEKRKVTASGTAQTAQVGKEPVSRYQVTPTEPIEITHKMYYKDTCWLHNQLVFKNETFREIIPELEKRYDVQIELKNTRLEACRYTAILEKETLEEVLKAMQLIKPFTYTIASSLDHSITSKKVIIN